MNFREKIRKYWKIEENIKKILRKYKENIKKIKKISENIKKIKEN